MVKVSEHAYLFFFPVCLVYQEIDYSNITLPLRNVYRKERATVGQEFPASSIVTRRSGI